MFLRPKPNPSNYSHGGPAMHVSTEGGPDFFSALHKRYSNIDVNAIIPNRYKHVNLKLPSISRRSCNDVTEPNETKTLSTQIKTARDPN